MNRLRTLLILAALVTGGSVMAPAQEYNHSNWRFIGPPVQRYKTYDRDDRYKSFDRDDVRRDRDDAAKYGRGDREQSRGDFRGHDSGDDHGFHDRR